jgi:hypothetical protein
MAVALQQQPETTVQRSTLLKWSWRVTWALALNVLFLIAVVVGPRW